MRIPLISFKIYFLFVIVLATASNVWGQVTYFSRSSGNWSDVNNWSVVGHAGAVAPQIPGGVAGSNSTNLVIIASAHTVTLDLDREMGSLTVGTGTAGTLIIGNDNANRLLTVKGAVTVGTTGTLTRNTLQTQGTHLLKIQGDNGTFTNNGVINFTDLTRPGGGWSDVDVEIEIGGNVQLTGTATAANSSLNNLTINKNNRSIKLGSNWSVAEQLYIQAGYLELGDAGAQFTISGSSPASNMQLDINGVLRIYGTASFPTGYAATLAGTNGTIEYSGTNQTVATQSVVAKFPNLLITGTGTKILSSDIIVENNVTISTATTVAASTFTIALSGDYTNNGTFTSGTGLVRFVGNTNQSISGTANFSNLEISQATPGTRVLANAPLAVSTATYLLLGALDLGTINIHSLATVTGPGTLALSAVAAGTTTFPAGSFTNFLTSAGTGTVEYNGAASYAIGTTPLAYANLKVSGTGIKTLTTSVTVTKNLAIDTGVDFTTASNTILLSGNFTNDGTLSGTGTVNFTNTSANQTISGTTSTTFNNLTVSKATGLALIASSAIRVNGTLALANPGNLRLGSNNLTIGPAGSITGNGGLTAITSFSNTRMIEQDGTNSFNGSLIREGTTTVALTKLFPVGTGSIYSYAIITQLAAAVTGTGSITVKAIPFSTTNNNIAKRYWRIKTSGISGITDARLTFKYDPTEITISGLPTLTVKRLDNNVDNNVVGSFTDNTTTRTFGVNAAGNFYLESEWRMGDPSNFAKTYYSYQSGSWDVPNNWTTDPTGTILQGQPGAGGPT